MSEMDENEITTKPQEGTQESPSTSDAQEASADDADEWGDDFNADRARKTIAKLRDELKDAKSDKEPQSEKDRKAIAALKRRISELESADPVDAAAQAAGRSQDVDEAPTLRSENLRLRVGMKVGLPERFIDRLRGDTEDEIYEDAMSLIELVSPSKPDTKPTERKPTERLRGGGDPGTEPEVDNKKLATDILAGL